MESAGGGSVEIAKALEDARQTLANKEADLNKGLADTLAGIGDAEGNALRAYNEGLANIAGAKDARDMKNELAKLQLEAQKQAQAYSKSGIEDEEEAQAQRNLMMEILKNADWTDAEKASAIQIFFGKNVDSAKAIVNGYNMYVNADDAVEAKIKELTKERGTILDSKSKDEKYKAAEENVGNTVPFFGLGLQPKKELDLLQENIKDYYDDIDPRINEIDKEIESLKNRKYTWDDLAKLMYGDGIITDSKLGKKTSSDYKYGNKK
jgi:chemotaxis protein histidine kinase CheA